jgi:type IV secretion system protein TrbG
MTRPALITFISLIALSACAGPARAGGAAGPTFAPALLIPDQPVAPATNVMAATLLAQSTILSSPPPRRTHVSAPLARVEAANRAAVHEPGADSYVVAVQVYPWSEGALYRLYTAPGEVSDIALQAGESLVSVAAGDTVRWVIGDTSSGNGAAKRTHILVKPSAAGLRTNLVIATDRRIYHVEVESSARAAMVSISWTYPEDALLALRRATAEEPVATGLAVDALNFNYRIEGDRPDWRPLRAFDDGRQVFIEFPPTLPQGEAPPLFVRGDKGRAELVNYRLKGRYYVVDRLFTAAELRLGEKRQQVVRIIRQGRPS